jgi:hypothetical protein
MGRKPRVDRSPEEKWQIVQEGIKSGNVSETCRRHGIAPNLFYRWKDEAETGDFLYFQTVGKFRMNFHHNLVTSMNCVAARGKPCQVANPNHKLREAIPSDHSYRFLIHDRDAIVSAEVDQRLKAFGLRVLHTPARAPKANA